MQKCSVFGSTSSWIAALSLAIVPGTIGCSSSDATTGTPPSTAAAEKWTLLAQGDWTLDPGAEEVDHCVKVPITEDIYLSAIRPIAPQGTHHTFVALSDTADGTRCVTAVSTGTLIYAAGLGSEGMHLPKGVGIKLPAGKVLNLSLHIYNPTEQPLSGTSGMEIVKMDPADVKYLSQTTLAGPIGFTIPEGHVTIKNECEIEAEQTAFVLFPHMHQLGRHLTTAVTIAGNETTLHDADYSFQEQTQIPIDLLKFEPGDKVTTTCTYDNRTGKTVSFGESSDTEMCFSVLFRYPETSSSFCKSLSTNTTTAP